MGRHPKSRDFYEDAQYLLRMGRGIMRDYTLPKPWREDIDARIKALASDLMMAPPRNIVTGVSRVSTPAQGVPSTDSEGEREVPDEDEGSKRDDSEP